MAKLAGRGEKNFNLMYETSNAFPVVGRKEEQEERVKRVAQKITSLRNDNVPQKVSELQGGKESASCIIFRSAWL